MDLLILSITPTNQPKRGSKCGRGGEERKGGKGKVGGGGVGLQERINEGVTVGPDLFFAVSQHGQPTEYPPGLLS